MRKFRITPSLRSAPLACAFILLAIMLQSCFSDNFDNVMKFETLPVIPVIQADGRPIPGNGGIMTNGVVSTTSVQLNWTRAEDTETPQGELWYRLYRSSSNNISTPALAEANGMVVTGWTQDIVTAVASGLTAGTTYYFNAVVRDGDGNTAAYMTVSVTTVTDAIYMFATDTHTGNLTTPTTASARADIDSYCIDTKQTSYPTLPCLNVRAFISISTTDYIAIMPGQYSVPTNRKIVGPTGITVASDWYDLLDGSILVDLESASVASNKWWSGSDENGNYLKNDACTACNTCSSWTDGTNGSDGESGTTNKTDGTWIDDKSENCNVSRHVLCVCW